MGHRLLFFPKFHCELNFIEMLWGYVKVKLRRMCTFSFSDLKQRLPELLDSIPLLPFVKRASRQCLRYMNGYRLGLIGPELDCAVRKYKGHRMIPPQNLQVIRDEFKAQHPVTASGGGFRTPAPYNSPSIKHTALLVHQSATSNNT